MKFDKLLGKINSFRKSELALFDCIASGVSVNSIFNSDGISYSSITPQMEEAFNMQFPNLKLTDLENYDSTQMQGIVNGWKGKLFEVNLRDKLNNGENIGGIQLEIDQTAYLAESPTNPGFDLTIENDAGFIVEELQIKATNSVSYIKETIEKYPDYDIITTDEIANNFSPEYITNIDGVDLINSGVSNEELTQTIEEVVVTDNSIGLLEFSPLLVAIIINGRKYLIGKYSLEKAVSEFVQDSSKSAMAVAGGSLVALIGLGTGVGILAAIAIRLGIKNDNTNWENIDRYKDINDKDLWNF